MTRGTLVWFGLGFVLLSFFAAFLGSWLARSVDTAPPAPTPEPSASTTASPDYEDVLAEILPAGSAVRAGSGAPEEGKGYEGDVYIDILTTDVYLFQDGAWTVVGNIREAAATNLTGEQGPAGAQGPQGEQGEQGAQGPSGAPGAPGTQVLLGTSAPDDDTCSADGDVFIDTAAVQFYECSDGAWVLFGPTGGPEPTPDASE
ncbi:collagen-like protein [Microbacterium ureisolvens]|uniref:Collagen-like protein n=1 Tax=Microbacterium ureisolvens TaxID=2781186 RepID=A0ABS7HZW3_9MICO|nr:collagen-like protein [Microbacterium ureisolvens]MBW9110932.1 collagen-like protein [Microbacterium ureisolvens]